VTTAPVSWAAADAAEMVDILDHFNGAYHDTVRLVAQHVARQLGLDGELDEAEATGADPHGVDFAVRWHPRTGAPGGQPESVRMTFPTPADSAHEVQALVLGTLMSARAAVGTDVPPTSLEHELTVNATLPTWVTSVVSVDDLTPTLRRVVVGGEALAGLVSLGLDQFVYVMVDRPGAASPVIRDGFDMAQYQQLPAAEAPAGAYYTIRSWDPAAHTVELWMVRHQHGALGRWSMSCQPGDTLAMWGPRRGFHAPVDCIHHLLVADDSGVAAVAARLDQLPVNHTAAVLCEADDEVHPTLSTRPNVIVQWLHRRGSEPGTSPALLDAVRRLDLPAGGAGWSAFGAGESRQMSAIRRYLRSTVGMPAATVSMTGYWRRQR
jgi:NADPH-dependent ferric siderophore reductase